MSISIPNPYTGKDDQTCSVSFAAQQSMASGVGSPQTEAEFNKSKLSGEWGVIKGKLANGEIPNGTKVLSYTNSASNSRGYLYVKGGELWKRSYFNNDGKQTDTKVPGDIGDKMIASSIAEVSIPQAVSPKPKPEPVQVFFGQGKYVSGLKFHAKDGEIIATSGTEYIQFNGKTNMFELYVAEENGFGYVKSEETLFLSSVMSNDKTWYAADQKDHTPNVTPKTTTPPASPTQVAAPTPFTPVNSGSDSVGSMSHEDVSAMFVKVKDDLAKEKGLNVKGANPALDAEVYKAIGDATGYTPAEVKAKIDAYKADGNKLSALKKKVLSGTKKVPEGKPQPTKATPAAPLNVHTATNKPAVDPKPNGVPTVATPKLADTIKADVKKEAEKDPGKVYTDEDVAAAYIISKDKIVADSNGKWTLYTKSDELDAEISATVYLKTKITADQQKIAIANYLASGKKLSVLKKQLAKQGAFKPQADTLKKSGSDKTKEEKEAEVQQKADEGYSPVGTPATGSPPIDTGKPMPKGAAQRAREAGDIADIPDNQKTDIYSVFKSMGSKAYLTSSNEQTYEAILSLQATFKAQGHEYSLLQILRVIDEEGAKKFKAENAKLFEKKTATWLTSPEAAAHLKENEKKLAKQAEEAKAKAEIEKAAKELEKNQPPLPADSTQYEAWSLDKAKRVSKTWLDAKPWTQKESRDLKHYTGSAYREMNGHLRAGSSISDRSKTAIEGSRSGMRPTTEPILVQRGTGADQFKSLGVTRGNTHLLWGVTGKQVLDEGFLSTSAGGQAAFGGEVKLEIECPIGTPMAYVAPISNFPSENEMLLQAGMTYKILRVERRGGQFVVRMRVVDWPGKAN